VEYFLPSTTNIFIGLMLRSVDVAPRVRHVANIFTPFPLRSVGVWFSSTFPHKSAPLSFAD